MQRPRAEPAAVDRGSARGAGGIYGGKGNSALLDFASKLDAGRPNARDLAEAVRIAKSTPHMGSNQ